MELSDIERKINKMQKKFDDNTLAMEMLKELKKSGQRKFIIIIILIIVLLGTNIAWLVYENQFETVSEEETTQYIEDLDNPTNSNFIQTIN